MSDNITHDYLNKIEEKINSFSEVLQNFGLNLIQNIGKTNRSIHILTDKIDELSKTTLDVKGLIPQLNLMLEKQDILENEVDLLKSLITKIAVPISNGETKREASTTIISNNATEILVSLQDLVRKSNDIEEIKALLQESKESIFEITGGHRILYEISKTLSEFKDQKEINDEIKKAIVEKIDFWKNKL